MTFSQARSSKNYKNVIIPAQFGPNAIRGCPFKDFGTIGLFVENYFGKTDIKYKIYSNAIFSIRKEQILSRPIEFYTKIIKSVDHHNSPMVGHFYRKELVLCFQL